VSVCAVLSQAFPLGLITERYDCLYSEGRSIRALRVVRMSFFLLGRFTLKESAQNWNSGFSSLGVMPFWLDFFSDESRVVSCW